MNYCIWLRCALISIFAFLLVSGIELRQPYSDLGILLEKAQNTQERLIQFLNSLQYKKLIFNPGIKGLKTIHQLLATRWNGDASRITDYARATIGVENIKEVYDCLNSFYHSNMTIVDVKDNFINPTQEHYRDINIIFKDEENAMLGEVQINTKPMLDYKNSEGHYLFDKIRNILAMAKMEMRELTFDEQKELTELTELSKVGYDAALQKSLIVDGDQIRLGVYGIIMNEDKALMTHTQSGSKQILNFPGGGVDFNEGFADALKRECREELGMEVEVGPLLYSSQELYTHDDFPGSRMFHLYFRVHPIEEYGDGELASEWYSIYSLPVTSMLPVDLEFVPILQDIFHKMLN